MFKDIQRTPLAIVLLVASFMAPTELSFYFAGLRLPPHRIALIILLPFALMRVMNHRGPRVGLGDISLVAFAAWSVYALSYHGEGASGFVFAASQALESCGAYLVARAFVRDEADFRGTLATLLLAVLIAALIALPEAILGKHFTHDALQKATNYYHPRTIEFRRGFVRAYATFDHPIHLGTFAASTLALVWCAQRQLVNRAIAVLIICTATLAALSSAPLLCLGLQFGMIVYERMTRGISNRLFLTLCGVCLLFLLISMVSSRSPFALIATGFTLDPWTGYYRLLTWEHGISNILSNPFFGIGLGDWTRPYWMYSDTVDAYWLLMAMRTGLPGIILLLATVTITFVSVWRAGARSTSPSVRLLARGWMFAIFAVSMAAATVHLWNVLNSYYFFLLGLAGWISNPLPSRRRAPAVKACTPKSAPARVRWGGPPAALACTALRDRHQPVAPPST